MTITHRPITKEYEVGYDKVKWGKRKHDLKKVKARLATIEQENGEQFGYYAQETETIYSGEYPRSTPGGR